MKSKKGPTMAELLLALEEKINKKMALFTDLGRITQELHDNEESEVLISKIYEVMQVIAIELEPVMPLINNQHPEIKPLFEELSKKSVSSDSKTKETL